MKKYSVLSNIKEVVLVEGRIIPKTLKEGTFGDNKKIVSFRMNVNNREKTYKGIIKLLGGNPDKVTTTTYKEDQQNVIEVVAFENIAENLLKFIKEGDTVRVFGTASISEYNDKQSLKVVCQNIDKSFQGTQPKAVAKKVEKPAEEVKAEDFVDIQINVDDLPF